MSRAQLWLGLALVLALATSLPAEAQIIQSTVNGNELSVSIQLPLNIGLDLTIAFDQVQGLTLNAFNITARVVLPLDPAILSRLPLGGLLSIPITFPVVIGITPSPTSQLSFHGAPTISLHTHLLPYSPNTTLRLYTAEPGGPFHDASTSTSAGSFRVGGRQPDFAREYTVVFDRRQIGAVISDKLFILQSSLTQSAEEIDDDVKAELDARLAAISQAIANNAIQQAITLTDSFLADIEEASGSAIPDVWSAGENSTPNVAGKLLTEASTLRFSLLRKSGAP